MSAKKPLLKISAKHKLTKKTVNLKFVSIAQAKYFNKELEDFVIEGIAKEEEE